MSTHSVAEAKKQSSKLIDRALNREGVVTDADPEWLRARPACLPASKIAATFLHQMRDEEWER
jgi:hypothetical protein